MSYFTSSGDTLPSPTLPNSELATDNAGSAVFTVGPWSGFNEGDTVQILGGFGNQVLGSAVVTAHKSFLGGSAKVESVDVPVPAADLRALGTGFHAVKARWVHKNGEAFGSKLSAESSVRIG